MNFDDEYESCESTYATLCVYSTEFDCDNISELIGVTPTRTVSKDLNRFSGQNGWFLSTEDSIQSNDLRRHLYHLVKVLSDTGLHSDHLSSCKLWVYCYWSSSEGNGGPIIDVHLMEWMSKLGLDIHFDFYG